MNAQIAQYLNIAESSIIRVEEWANVLFVVVRGFGARFVSKKVTKMSNIPAPRQTSHSTEWSDGVNLSATVVVSKHNLYDTYSAGYMHGCHLEWVGSYTSLELAWEAAKIARAEYVKSEKVREIVADRAFAAAQGRMQTSTGEWVTADEWDEIEGAA